MKTAAIDYTKSKKQPGPYTPAELSALVSQQGYYNDNGVLRIVAYGRVSTEEQSLDMQTDALTKAGAQIFFMEKVGAQNAKRPQFHLMMRYLRPGDTVVVYAYNRLSRDLKTLLSIVDRFKAMGVKLRSTTEPHIDPFTTSGRMMFSMVGAVGENERNLIRDRTRHGMAAKMERGTRMGRPIIATAEKIKLAKRLRKAKTLVPEIARRLNWSASLVYRHT